MTAPVCRCGRLLRVHAADEGTCCYVHEDGTQQYPSASPDNASLNARADFEASELARAKAEAQTDIALGRAERAETIADAAQEYIASRAKHDPAGPTCSECGQLYAALVAACEAKL